MSYSILRVAKVKNSTASKGIQKHNQRENEKYGNKDIDHDRTHLNYDLINDENIEYKNRMEEVIAEGYNGQRKVRSDAIKHVDGIITSDKAFFDSLPADVQNQYFKDSLEFVKKEYGEKNLLYATVHLDEKTPHMHFGFVPLTEDGRLSAKDVVGNKKALSLLQD
ncbi:MobV family relaxase [Virgibacillus flavescens]|uniref:MobV family relaxase n=1 Tax=Virgibacillus flavescens TaxID=1611422 RepID=UPI003D3530D3